MTPLPAANSVFDTSIKTFLDDLQNEYNQLGQNDLETRSFDNRLQQLIKTYGNDSSIGIDRYRLYEARAYLLYVEGDTKAATNNMDRAVQIKGERFPEADKFLTMLKLTDSGSPQSYASPTRNLLQKIPSYALPLLLTILGWLILFVLIYLADLTLPADQRGEGYGWLALFIAPILYIALFISIIMLISGLIHSRRK